MTRIVVLVVLILSLALTAACHTIHGMGKDVESVGQAIGRSSGK